MGRHREAETYMLRALSLMEQIYGGISSYAANIHGGLAINYRTLGEIEKALHHTEKQLEIHEIIFGKQSYSYSQALNNYALAVQDLGDLEKAEELHAESIRIKELILPEYSANLGIGYYNMEPCSTRWRDTLMPWSILNGWWTLIPQFMAKSMPRSPLILTGLPWCIAKWVTF